MSYGGKLINLHSEIMPILTQHYMYMDTVSLSYEHKCSYSYLSATHSSQRFPEVQAISFCNLCNPKTVLSAWMSGRLPAHSCTNSGGDKILYRGNWHLRGLPRYGTCCMSPFWRPEFWVPFHSHGFCNKWNYKWSRYGYGCTYRQFNVNINTYTGCFTTLGRNCRRWFPRFLWSKKFI